MLLVVCMKRPSSEQWHFNLRFVGAAGWVSKRLLFPQCGYKYDSSRKS